MGIRKYFNKFRASYSTKTGTKKQLYFNTYEEAEKHLIEKKGHILKDHNFKRVKKSSAKDKKLPIGMHKNFCYKINAQGEKIYYQDILCTISGRNKSGERKIKYFSRAYGKSRTINEAIDLLVTEKKLYLKKYYDKQH